MLKVGDILDTLEGYDSAPVGTKVRPAASECRGWEKTPNGMWEASDGSEMVRVLYVSREVSYVPEPEPEPEVGKIVRISLEVPWAREGYYWVAADSIVEVLPDPIEEPKGLGAVVETQEGTNFVHNGGGVWREAEFFSALTWDDFSDFVTKVLSEGV